MPLREQARIGSPHGRHRDDFEARISPSIKSIKLRYVIINPQVNTRVGVFFSLKALCRIDPDKEKFH